MKTLYIIRHAKSSWEYDLLHDLERPLTQRGEKDAVIMGSWLRKKTIFPGIVISSPALRAVSTARIICDEVGYDKNRIEINADLYFKEIQDILSVIHAKGARHETFFIFGHNPAFSNLAHALAKSFSEIIPTCGIVAVKFDIESWGLAEPGIGVFDFFEFPKKYRK